MSCTSLHEKVFEGSGGFKPWILTTLGWDAIKDYDVADLGKWGSWKKMEPGMDLLVGGGGAIWSYMQNHSIWTTIPAKLHDASR